MEARLSKTIRWLSQKAQNAWYGFGAWVTVTLWALFDDRQGGGMYSVLVVEDRRNELVVPHGFYEFPDHPVLPRKTVVFDDLHLCEPRMALDLGPLVPFAHTVAIGEFEVPKPRKPRSTTKKHKSIKALAPKRKAKTGKKPVVRKRASR
jgi:hypothetical protein